MFPRKNERAASLCNFVREGKSVALICAANLSCARGFAGTALRAADGRTDKQTDR